MGRVTIQHTIQHSLQLMRCHRCHICCSRSVLANLGCVCRPSWWIWLWPEAKAGPVWAKSGSKCIISLVFVNLVFRPRLYPTFELSGPYQHIWMISHDFRLSQLQHPRNRQQHARLCHNRGNRRRQVYKGTLIISIFYNYYHLMKNNPEHDKKGSKTLISRDEGRLHPPPPCRRSKKETEGDLHATRSLRLSF